MSVQYDKYLLRHRSNVKRGFEWIRENLPDLVQDGNDYEYHIGMAHDYSKDKPDEYEAYDAYFYGGNRSYKVVQNFNKAWLLHIHRNPHHWQHWVLINDEPEEGEILIEIPYQYIIEMICDWWAFSWEKGNLFEIFEWYEKRRDYIKLHKNSRKIVEYILQAIKLKLESSSTDSTLAHHGVKGQKWGVKNGPPYPLQASSKSSKIVKDAISSGKVSKIINEDKQKRHTKSGHVPGRSYLNGDLDYAQELVDKLSGTGEPILDRNNQWVNKERVVNDDTIGVQVDRNTGNETETNKAIITYSKTGSHIYPGQK